MNNVYTISYKVRVPACSFDGLYLGVYKEGFANYAARSERGAIRQLESEVREGFGRDPFNLQIREVERMNKRMAARWLRNFGR